ncbi:hypothetical protein V6N11_013137 [Hibiscus sabdariffa]|uniref:Uncharacterized protein n=1 Tax=Hibiscus sabdariffa TaxID=183260 RepID=A0ABR2NFA5_9ROSI
MAMLAWNVRGLGNKINILKAGKCFIDAEISVAGESEWFRRFIYGPPYKEEKKDFWEFMKNLRNGNGDRWLVMGDSNVVSSQEEKIGGVPFNVNDARSYFDFVDTLGLIDIPITGGDFTWSNQRSEEDAILEKLDRVLCSPGWNSFFPKAVALLDIAIGSDHALVLVFLKGIIKGSIERSSNLSQNGSWKKIAHLLSRTVGFQYHSLGIHIVLGANLGE